MQLMGRSERCYGVDLRQAHLDILLNGYFSRVWTAEEAAFARRCSFIFGTSSLSRRTMMVWQTQYDFGKASTERTRARYHNYFRHVMSADMKWDLTLAEKRKRVPDWVLWVRGLQAFGATEDHDHIYGVYAYFSKLGFELARPDYELNVR